MNLKIELCNNKYEMDENMFQQAIVICDNILNIIEALDIGKMDIDEKLAVLGVIAEAYPLLQEKEKWDEYGYKILGQIKEHIRQGHLNSTSLHCSMGELGVYVTALSRNSGYYGKLLNSINNVIIEGVYARLQLIEKSNGNACRTSLFDTISGLSGIGRYLLFSNEITKDDKKAECLKAINSYLIKLAKYKDINGYKIPGWFVSGEMQPTERYRKDYPNGSINYSLSHGIVGPLVHLTKSMKNGIIVGGQKEAILFILEELNLIKQELPQSGYLWPGILSYENYIRADYKQENERLSWCYGSPGVLIAMLEAAELIGYKSVSVGIKNELSRLAQLRHDKYHLSSPIICHGYAGTALVFYFLYDQLLYSGFKEKGNALMNKVIHSFNKNYPFGFKDIIYSYDDGIEKKEEKDSLDFLSGSGGITMSLLSLLKDETGFLPMLML